MKRRFLSLVLVVNMLFIMYPTSNLFVVASSSSGKISMPMVAAGYFQSAVLKSDGSLWIWGSTSMMYSSGSSEYAQLAKQTTPEKIMDDVIFVSLSATGAHGSLIKSDNSLWKWGNNAYGYLGDGTTKSTHIPVKIMDDAIYAACGGAHSAAIKSDNSLWMWGNNQQGQLGTGDNKAVNKPTKVMDNVKKVSLGRHHSAAIKEDNSLWVWGENKYGKIGDGSTANKSTPTKIMSNVADVYLSGDTTYAIKTDGTLWAWGSNEYGEFGVAELSSSNEPLKVMDNVAQVASNAVLKTDGSVWTWWGIYHSKAGLEFFKPAKILDNVKSISCASINMAVKNDNSIWCWNTGSYSNWVPIGNGTNTTDSYIPIKIMEDEKEKPILVYLNDKEIEFDVHPIMEENRTLVPLRAIFESMEMKVDWDGSTSTITASGKGNSITMRVNKTTATVNGNILEMDVPPRIIEGRTLVPVRFIAESVGAEVEWDGKNRIVYITYTPDENYKTFIVDYYAEVEAYKFESGYYVDSSIILPLLSGYDDKYNDLSGVLKIWDEEVNIGLNIPYDLTSKKEGDYVALEIKCSGGTLLKDSVYKNHYKKSNVVMTRKGDKSYVNLDDVLWLNNYTIVDDNLILSESLVNSVSTLLDSDILSNPLNEYGDKKWAFSGWQIGWTDKKLEDHITYQEIWGDVAKCSLALFDGEGFDIFKRRINAMVDVLVMPTDEQMSDNIVSKMQLTKNGEILVDFGKYLSSYDEAFIELTKVYADSPKTKDVMDRISTSSSAIFTWADAYMETYEEVLTIQAVMECSEENRRVLKEFVDELPMEYKKGYSYAFELIDKRLKEYENYNYGKMFLKNIAEKGGSFAVQTGINLVVKNGLENVGKGTAAYDIGTFALQVGRFAIDIVANNQLEGIEKQGVFHALYDFNNIAYNRYTDLYNQRTTYLHDLPISYQEKLKNAAIISILSGNEARRTFVHARELILTKSQLKKNEVGHQALLDYCDEVDFLLNKWKSAIVQ